MEVVIKVAELPSPFSSPRDRAPWAISQRVTASMKSIKTQSEPNPRYFPKGSFGESCSVTTPIVNLNID